MWPTAQPYTWHPERKPFKVTFVPAAELPALAVDPTVFAFDSAVSYQPIREQSKELLRMPEMSAGKQEFMPISGQVLKPRASGAVSDYSVWERRTNDFADVWAGERVFGRTERELQLVVLLSENLESSGFVMAELSDAELKAVSAGWEIQILVDIDKSGLPAHVLIEKGTGNKDIDALICSKILVSRADKKETKSGRVTVSYGSE